MKCEVMRLPFIHSLASLFTGVMVGVALSGISGAAAGEYEDARKLITAQKWSEALPLLKALNEEEPDSVVIAQDLAQALLRLNRREEALELLRLHHLVKPAEFAAKSFLSKESFRFYQQGLDWLSKRSYAQACERFEKALEKDQAHFDILFRLSQCEILDGNADLGLKSLDGFERIHGKSTESSLWRARALALRGRFDEAQLLFSANATAKLSDSLTELNSLWWGEALLAANQKGNAGTVFENDAKRFPAHLQTLLASLKLRASLAESPNQYLAIHQELTNWEKVFAARIKEKKKRLGDVTFEPLDLDILQRAATDLRTQINTQLPSPRPTPAPRSSPSKR